MNGDPFWVEESNDQLSLSLKRKRNVRTKKVEYVGWGSKPLIEFLESIGKDTSKTYSQQEVTAIVTEYVNSHNLLNPQKKKRVMCDDRLYSLFRKKSIPRLKIYDLLEAHFTENNDESEEELPNSSEEEDILIEAKGSKVSLKKKVPEVPKSCFAAVIVENIKLVYLKRSLVQDLLKTPGSFEDKIVGSFVRVKSDPNDYVQKHSHQLQQVEGVRKASGSSDAAFEIHLQLSNLMKDVPISLLSDDNFYEEECGDLHERIKAGLLKRPTVVELQLKAEVLHKDITGHWIEREIKLLQKRIDQANEKGWRKQLFEFMEKKQLLQTKKEQDRLLSTIPKVIAEELEPEVKTVNTLVEKEEDEEDSRSPKSFYNGSTDKSGAGDTLIISQAIHNDSLSGKEQNRVFVNGDISIADGNDQLAGAIHEKGDTIVSVRIESTVEMDLKASREIDISQGTQGQVTQTEVIELSDDDSDGEDQKIKKQAAGLNLEDPIWHYLDPQRYIQGPFPLALLKRWYDASYFDTNFRVWKVGDSPGHSALLTDVLRLFFPAK